MTLQCVILAGGLGTRLRPATETVPKPLVRVLGRPFADWQLSLLAAQGIERVLYCVGYRGDMLLAHVGDGSRFGLDVSWSAEGERLLGTAGALRLALDAGLLEDAFLVLYGDSYLPASARASEEAWQRSGAPALMTVVRNEDRWDASNCIYRDGRVVLYDKSRPLDRRDEMRWIDYGRSVLTRAVVDELVSPGAVVDLADLQHNLSVSGRLAGLEVRERFYEAGSTTGLRELEAFLLESGVAFGPLPHRQDAL
ncbi:MAG: nucleotidyl transferase [Chloroflexi bacterium]|nr:MAG: nucleotidyl transferase [Chloroflexota bacterium]